MPAFPATSKQDTIAADGRYPALPIRVWRGPFVDPLAITDLVITTPNATTAVFNFTPPAGGTNFLYQIATGTQWGGDRYGTAGGAADGQYNYTGLTPESTHLARMFVNGVVSNVVQFTLPPAVGITDLSIETTAENSTYNFSLLPGTANYTFQTSLNGGSTWGGDIVVPASSLATGTYTRTTTANTAYQYRILTDGVASNVVAATTPNVGSPPPTDLSAYQLDAGHYVDQEFSMVAILPRPDSETGNFVNDTVLARYRWAYYDGVNPVRYEVALKVFGGAAPHIYELVSGPAGMTVGNDRTAAEHGVVKWTPTQAYSDVAPASVVVRVHGQDGNFIDLTWTIQTSSSTNKFMFADADNGNDTTGDGSIGNPFQTLYKFTGNSGQVTFPGRIVYLRGSTANYTTVSQDTPWMPHPDDVIPARIHINANRNPYVYLSFPDESVTIDFSDAQILTGDGQKDFFFGGSSTADMIILGSAINAAERHNFWCSSGERGHFQYITFQDFAPQVGLASDGTPNGTSNSVPIFSNKDTGLNRLYWSCHAVKEAPRSLYSQNSGLLFILFSMKYWADEYCSAQMLGGNSSGTAFKDTCYWTSTRYFNLKGNTPGAGNVRFAFMCQTTAANSEICYSQIEGPIWFNLQNAPGVGKLVEYRNTVYATDTNESQAIRAWSGPNRIGPWLSINSVLQSNGPSIVNSLVIATGTECHARNSSSDRPIDTATMTLRNQSGGTQFRDLYLYTRGHEIG